MAAPARLLGIGSSRLSVRQWTVCEPRGPRQSWVLASERSLGKAAYTKAVGQPPCAFPGARQWKGARAEAAAPGSFQGGGSGIGQQSGSMEKGLRTTVELDKLIDTLRYSHSTQLPQVVAENIFSFDQNFWLRLATRADTCSSPLERAELEELSQTLMAVVERLVRCTQERMDSTSDRLVELLLAAAVLDKEQVQEEMVWPPEDPNALQRLRQEVEKRDRAGALDDSFLASVTAQLRQAVEKGDRPGLVAMLQKVLQLYAAVRFGRHSYALKEGGGVDRAEELLETILQGDAREWEAMLRGGLALGSGQVGEEEFFKALELRTQRMLMRTESGSYEQRILGEFLVEVEAQARLVTQAFKS